MTKHQLAPLFLFLAGSVGCSSAGNDTDEQTLVLDDQIECEPAGSSATPVSQTLVGPSRGFVPRNIVATGDGIWFTESQAVSLNHLTETGVHRQLDAPFPAEWIFDAAVGADQNVWFDNVDGLLDPHIGRMTPEGVATLFPIPSGERARHVTRGLDDAIWFTAGANIGRVTMDGTVSEISVGAQTGDITSGPEGTIWFTEPDDNRIGRLTADGTLSHFDVPTPDSGLGSITQGPDGLIWFAETNTGKVGRMSHDGQLIEMDVVAAPARLGEITAGPDGRVWFTIDTGDYHHTRIGSVSACGVTTFVDLPRVQNAVDFDPPLEQPAVPYGIAGGDDELWVTACLEPFETGVVFRLDLGASRD
jgi:virginiamycin B lyase